MKTYDYLSGIDLEQYLSNPLLGQEAIVEGLIFKDTVNIFYSEPSAGKSVIAVNMLLAMSAGHPVFGYLPMPRAVKCSFLQLEGSMDEQFGRMKDMMEKIKCNVENIAWHTSPLFVENQHTQQTILEELEHFKPEVIFIDSFYCLTSKGLSKEDSFLPVRDMLKLIKKKTNSTLIILHHTSKVQYDGTGSKVEKDEPFLGSQYLKAFADYMAHVKRVGENKTLIKTTKRQRNNEGIKDIMLEFDKNNWTLSAIPEESTKSAVGQVCDFLKEKFSTEDETSVDEISKATGLTKRHIRRMKNDHHFDHLAFFEEHDGLFTKWLKKNTPQNGAKNRPEVT